MDACRGDYVGLLKVRDSLLFNVSLIMSIEKDSCYSDG